MDTLVNSITQNIRNFANPIFTILLYAITILFICALAYNRKNEEGKFAHNRLSKIKHIIMKIWFNASKPYTSLLKGQPIPVKVLLITFGISMIIAIVLISYGRSRELFNVDFDIKVVIYTLTLSIAVLAVIHLVIFPIATFAAYIVSFLNSVESRIGNLALLSFIMPCIYVMLIISKLVYIKNNVIILPISIGLIYSYYLSFKGLIICANSPQTLNTREGKFKKYNKYIAILSWLVIVLLNLFCQVIFVSSIDGNSFCSSQKPVEHTFDLLYFTIITFATVGYGDISPVGVLGKLSSIIIVLSSTVFLIVFIGSILSSNIGKSQKLKFVKYYKTGKKIFRKKS